MASSLLLGCQPQPAEQQAPPAADTAAEATQPAPLDTTPGYVPGVAAPEPIAPAAAVLRLTARADSGFALPHISLPSPAASGRINAVIRGLAFEDEEAAWTRRPTAQALEGAAATYKREGHGLSGLGYEVLSNAHGLLSLALHREYLGAYPSTSTRHLSFELRTGRQLRLPELLRDTASLRQQWRAAISRRVAEHLRTAGTDFPDAPELPAELPGMLRWNAAARQVTFEADEPRFDDFAITRQGLTLYYSFDFPHVIQAAAPAPDYAFAWAELRPLLRPAGLLTPLAR